MNRGFLAVQPGETTGANKGTSGAGQSFESRKGVKTDSNMTTEKQVPR